MHRLCEQCVERQADGYYPAIGGVIFLCKSCVLSVPLGHLRMAHIATAQERANVPHVDAWSARTSTTTRTLLCRNGFRLPCTATDKIHGSIIMPRPPPPSCAIGIELGDSDYELLVRMQAAHVQAVFGAVLPPEMALVLRQVPFYVIEKPVAERDRRQPFAVTSEGIHFHGGYTNAKYAIVAPDEDDLVQERVERAYNAALGSTLDAETLRFVASLRALSGFEQLLLDYVATNHQLEYLASVHPVFVTSGADELGGVHLYRLLNMPGVDLVTATLDRIVYTLHSMSEFALEQTQLARRARVGSKTVRELAAVFDRIVSLYGKTAYVSAGHFSTLELVSVWLANFLYENTEEPGTEQAFLRRGGGGGDEDGSGDVYYEQGDTAGATQVRELLREWKAAQRRAAETRASGGADAVLAQAQRAAVDAGALYREKIEAEERHRAAIAKKRSRHSSAATILFTEVLPSPSNAQPTYPKPELTTGTVFVIARALERPVDTFALEAHVLLTTLHQLALLMTENVYVDVRTARAPSNAEVEEAREKHRQALLEARNIAKYDMTLPFDEAQFRATPVMYTVSMRAPHMDHLYANFATLVAIAGSVTDNAQDDKALVQGFGSATAAFVIDNLQKVALRTYHPSNLDQALDESSVLAPVTDTELRLYRASYAAWRQAQLDAEAEAAAKAEREAKIAAGTLKPQKKRAPTKKQEAAAAAAAAKKAAKEAKAAAAAAAGKAKKVAKPKRKPLRQGTGDERRVTRVDEYEQDDFMVADEDEESDTGAAALTALSVVLDAAKQPTLQTIGHGVRVAPSQIVGAGRGLYAMRAFAAGEPITRYTGLIISYRDAMALPHAQQSHLRNLVYLRWSIDGARTLAGERITEATPLHGLGGAAFANDAHGSSFSNNADFTFWDPPGTRYPRGDPDQHTRILFLYATRPIAANEEIFALYGRNYWIREQDAKELEEHEPEQSEAKGGGEEDSGDSSDIDSYDSELDDNKSNDMESDQDEDETPAAAAAVPPPAAPVVAKQPRRIVTTQITVAPRTNPVPPVPVFTMPVVAMSAGGSDSTTVDDEEDEELDLDILN